MVGSIFGLNTQPGYVYDICLNTVDSNGNSLYTISSLDSEYSNYFQEPTYGIYLNVSNITANQYINCSVRNKNSYPNINSDYSPLNIY
jgi:phage anti-repressor protein